MKPAMKILALAIALVQAADARAAVRLFAERVAPRFAAATVPVV